MSEDEIFKLQVKIPKRHEEILRQAYPARGGLTKAVNRLIAMHCQRLDARAQKIKEEALNDLAGQHDLSPSAGSSA